MAAKAAIYARFGLRT